MSAIKESITYFEKGGPDNTLETLRLAVAEAKRLGIKKLVAASSTGFTAEALMGMKEAEGLDITIVTLAYTDREPYNRLSEEKRRAFIEKGFHVCTAGHALTRFGKHQERQNSNTPSSPGSSVRESAREPIRISTHASSCPAVPMRAGSALSLPSEEKSSQKSWMPSTRCPMLHSGLALTSPPRPVSASVPAAPCF